MEPGVTEWTALELRTAGRPVESLLNHCVPLALGHEDPCRGFYVVWFETDVIRLRLDSSDPTNRDASARLIRHLNTRKVVQEGSYTPEQERYGGAHGLAIAERFFCQSSALTLRLLESDRRPSETQQGSLKTPLAAACLLTESMAQGLEVDAQQLRERWLEDLMTVRGWSVSDALLSRCARIEPLPSYDDFARFLANNAPLVEALGGALGSALRQVVSGPTSITSSLIHGFMNRLAVQPADEVYVALLLCRASAAEEVEASERSAS